MQFKEFSNLAAAKFTELQKGGKLFRSSLPGQKLWEIYIENFKPEDNPVFRDPDSSQHNCNLDKSFIRRYGNIVAINENYEISTMWDLNIPADSGYSKSISEMSKALKESRIEDVFFETYEELNSLNYEKNNKKQTVFRLGIESNHKIYTPEEAAKFGVVEAGKVYRFDHFYSDLSKDFVDQSGKSQSSIISEYRDFKNVFKRGLDEIPLDTLELISDLIKQGSLLDGETHLYKLTQIIPMKKVYDKLSEDKKDNWAWVNSYKLPFAKFRNELIGTLCIDLSQGVELNKACMDWNKKVDPANYMKAKSPITKKQIQEAQKFIENNGYLESFERRFATIDDINVDEILHSNKGGDKIKTASIFDNLKPTSPTRHKKSQFAEVEEVTIEKFMNDILPSCTSVEAFFENRMENNLVSLTTANNKDSKKMFKWDNNFSWTYNGNLAGKSQIKEAVKEAGGRVDGILRFSTIWNESGKDNSDLDAWCTQPNNESIGYSTGFRKDRGGSKSSCGGQLDLDNTNPGSKIGIENIYFSDKKSLKSGSYVFYINQFSARNSQGFKAEIEVEGELYHYEFNRPLLYKENVKVATVTYLKDGTFEVLHHLPETNSSKNVWSIETNQFHKVNLVCLSPNHWGDNNTGNKHYFFMIDGCKSDVPLRSFHNENLNSELLSHRKVTEVLGTSTMLSPAEKQLCGLGFNATVRDEIILKLSGSFKRTVKVKF